MSDLKTVLSDNDGDGIYDDVQVVNVIEEDISSPTPKTYYHHEPSRTHSSSSSRDRIFSSKTIVKTLLIIAGILLGFGILLNVVFLVLGWMF